MLIVDGQHPSLISYYKKYIVLSRDIVLSQEIPQEASSEPENKEGFIHLPSSLKGSKTLYSIEELAEKRITSLRRTQ